MEMTGRMESVENLSEQRRGFASQRQVSHPSHRPLEIADAIPTFPQPDDDTFLHTYKQQNQGDISIALGTFLSPLDNVLINDKVYYHRQSGTRSRPKAGS